MGNVLKVPKQYSDFDCSEYFNKYQDGVYDSLAYLWIVLPKHKIFINRDKGHLTVGWAGTDGIEFCYQQMQKGVWAYYPIDDDYEFKASSLADLVAGYQSGKITV
jgi:hypothetical protein